MNEATLVERLRNRDPEVLGLLLQRYGDEIQAVAQLILRDRAEAEDVLMETMVTAWQRGAAVRESAALRAWLLRVATNKSLSVRRRLTRALHDSTGARAPRVAHDHGPLCDTRLTVLALVDQLPLRMRAAVVLRYYADLPVEEVARVLGRSPNTIKAQLRLALERLRDELTG